MSYSLSLLLNNLLLFKVIIRNAQLIFSISVRLRCYQRSACLPGLCSVTHSFLWLFFCENFKNHCIQNEHNGRPSKTDGEDCLRHQSFSNQHFLPPKDLEIDPICEGETVKRIRTLAPLLPPLTGAREPFGLSARCDFKASVLLCVVFPPVSPPHVHQWKTSGGISFKCEGGNKYFL